MEYITKFENYIEYERAKPNLILPNVSLCTQEDEVYYNPWSFAEVYLTFLAKENGTFTFTPQNSNVISYSTDDGETWTEGNTVSVNNGDKIMWKGTMTPSKSGIGTFSSTASFDVQGNVMSLLYGDNYKEQTDLTGKNRAFHDLFKNNTKVVNARSLSLPATTLSNNCYYSMFQGCTNLSYIKAMFTTMPSAFLTCTTNWVDGVSSSGTFVKNSAATWTTTGTDGIPNGWTVETASE